MANLAFNIEFLGTLVTNEQGGEGDALLTGFATYSNTFMNAVHSKDFEKMRGFCLACMLVLDSIVDHASTAKCQSLFLSFLVHSREYFSSKLFQNFRIQALKLMRLFHWLIQKAFGGNLDARHFFEGLLECDQTDIEEDFSFFETCVVVAVENMVSSLQIDLGRESIENADQCSASLQRKLAILKTIFHAYVQCVELSPSKQINFVALGTSRESNLICLDCIVKYVTEFAAASFRSEPNAPKFSFREGIPTFSMFGEVIEFLSKALNVYQLQSSQDRTHVHFIHTLVVTLFETSAKMNSVTFMGHAAMVCHEQLLPILDDSQKHTISNAILDFLGPKLQLLQAGKISALSYEAVISIAIQLMPPSSKCTGLHQMVQSTALLICSREANIPWAVKTKWIRNILSKRYPNAVSDSEMEQILSFFNQCFKYWESFPQEAIDNILTAISTINIEFCSNIDFLSSFIRHFLRIAVLLPTSIVSNFLGIICEILLQVPKHSQYVDFLKVFPPDLLETLCDILSSSVETTLLWSSVFVLMSLRSNFVSFQLYGECLNIETSVASEFGFAASKNTMRGCSLELEASFFIILHSLEFTQDRMVSSRFLNNLCSTCDASASPSRVADVAQNIISRLQSVDTCIIRMLEAFKIQQHNDCANTVKFASQCRMGILLSCHTHSDLDIASQIWNASSRDGHMFLMQHLKEHLSSLLKFGKPIHKGFMKILSFCPDTSELISFVFNFQCAPIYALQTMGHLLRMQPEQKQISQQNIEDLILYLRRWSDFLLESKKSTSELDKIWCFWFDLWLSLSVHLLFAVSVQKRSKFDQELLDLIGEKACSRLLFLLTSIHMHTSSQNEIFVQASSLICKGWLERRLKFSAIRKALLEQLMQNPELKQHHFCGFYFESLMEFHVQKEKHLLSDSFSVGSIDFACLSNCFYIQCASMSSNKFYHVFRILEAADYFYAKELNDALLLSTDAIMFFMKNFACAFGIFKALQGGISGNAVIKKLCLIPFLSIVFMRTNGKSKALSDHNQKELYSALFHSIESFKVAECLAVFALESNELQLMTEFRKALHCADTYMMDSDSARHPTKKYDDIISRLTSRILSSSKELPQHYADDAFRATSRSFLCRKFDEEQVDFERCMLQLYKGESIHQVMHSPNYIFDTSFFQNAQEF